MRLGRRSVAMGGLLASALPGAVWRGGARRALWLWPAAAPAAVAAAPSGEATAEAAPEGTAVTEASEFVERKAAELGAETARVTIEKLAPAAEGGYASLCKSLQLFARLCNALQRSATLCNAL